MRQELIVPIPTSGSKGVSISSALVPTTGSSCGGVVTQSCQHTEGENAGNNVWGFCK